MRLTLEIVVGVCLCVEVIRLRLLLHGHWREQAEQAQQRLTGMTVVDGYELPLPTDVRWQEFTLTFEPDTKAGEIGPQDRSVLSLAKIHVREGRTVYIHYGAPLSNSKAMKDYAAEVLRCFRNRLVREAIDG